MRHLRERVPDLSVAILNYICATAFSQTVHAYVHECTYHRMKAPNQMRLEGTFVLTRCLFAGKTYKKEDITSAGEHPRQQGNIATREPDIKDLKDEAYKYDHTKAFGKGNAFMLALMGILWIGHADYEELQDPDVVKGVCDAISEWHRKNPPQKTSKKQASGDTDAAQTKPPARKRKSETTTENGESSEPQSKRSKAKGKGQAEPAANGRRAETLPQAAAGGGVESAKARVRHGIPGYWQEEPVHGEIDSAGVLYYNGLFIMSEPRCDKPEKFDSIPRYRLWRYNGTDKLVEAALVLPHPKDVAYLRTFVKVCSATQIFLANFFWNMDCMYMRVDTRSSAMSTQMTVLFSAAVCAKLCCVHVDGTNARMFVCPCVHVNGRAVLCSSACVHAHPCCVRVVGIKACMFV